MLTAISPRLTAALREISVATDLRAATVAARDVTPDEPAELRQLLGSAIYDELHAGRAALDYPPGRRPRDLAVEAGFRAALPHAEVTRQVTVLDTDTDRVLVLLDSVRVWVPRGKVSGATVQLPAGRPALSPGYFLADGLEPLAVGQPVLRVYVHLRTISAALAAWRAVLSALAGLEVGYRAKVTSWPDTLPRRDGLVVYLACPDLDIARQLDEGRPMDAARRVADATRDVPGIGGEVSVFAQPIAPGVAIAAEPSDRRPGMRGLSFGEHRSAALADGLVRHAEQRGDRAPVAGFVRQAFLDAAIDPEDPYRNLDTAAVPGAG